MKKTFNIMQSFRNVGRIFALVFAIVPFAAVLHSCGDDDDDIPNVGVQCTISGGVFDGDVIYIAQGTPLKIDGLTLINHTDSDGAIGAVNYYWDHYLVGTNPTPPYELILETTDLPVGTHLLQAQMPIYVENYPICWGYIQYVVEVVADASTLPGGDDSETSRVVSGVIKDSE